MRQLQQDGKVPASPRPVSQTEGNDTRKPTHVPPGATAGGGATTTTKSPAPSPGPGSDRGATKPKAVAPSPSPNIPTGRGNTAKHTQPAPSPKPSDSQGTSSSAVAPTAAPRPSPGPSSDPGPPPPPPPALNPLAVALPVVLVLVLIAAIVGFFIMRRRRRHRGLSTSDSGTAASGRRPLTHVLVDGYASHCGHTAPSLKPTKPNNKPQMTTKHFLDFPSEFTIGHTPAEVKSACSNLAQELHMWWFTLQETSPNAAQAVLLAASTGLPAELQELVWSGDKGLQQDVVMHHVWKVLQAAVWSQAFCSSGWLGKIVSTNGLQNAAGTLATSDFQALGAAWPADSPLHRDKVEAATAGVLSSLMPGSSMTADLLRPLVQKAMQFQVAVLACHPGLRIVVDGWESCRPSRGGLQQLLQGLKPLDRQLQSAVGTPVRVVSEHTAGYQHMQLVLLCTRPGVVWAPTPEATARSISIPQEVKLLQVTCGSANPQLQSAA